MQAYAEAYLNDVVENQGKLFDLIAQDYPDKDTKDFINAYMLSKTRKSIDEAKAYVNTMDAKELWQYFLNTENYTMPSAEIIKKIPVDFLIKAYHGLHDLDLDLAVKKVGEV